MAEARSTVRRGVGILAAVAVSGVLGVPVAAASPVSQPPVVVPVAQQDLASSTLSWGVRDSFTSYIQGRIARGQWNLTNVSENPDRIFTWTGGTGQVDPETGEGRASFSGGVQFQGHKGHGGPEYGLDLAMDNPLITFEESGGSTTGTLYLDVTSLDLDGGVFDEDGVAFAELEFGNVDIPAEGTADLSASATLTTAGSQAFAGFYNAGEQLDPVNLTLAVAAAPETESTEAPEPDATDEPSEAPEPAEEPELSDEPSAKPSAGPRAEPQPTEPPAEKQSEKAAQRPAQKPSESMSQAPSKSPNDRPSGSASSGPSGPASSKSSSSAKKSASPGSAPFNSAPSSSERSKDAVSSDGDAAASAEPEVCEAQVLTNAELDWGLRQSFRNYIQGPIARGSWDLNGADYDAATGHFGFDGGSGAWQDGTGVLDYTGAVHFTGHKGVLDMTLANPEVRITGAATAELYLDVVSKDLDGGTLDEDNVRFATLSGQTEVDGDTLTLTDAGATLTKEGAKAFAGFYEAGEALDSVSVSATVTDELTDCLDVAPGGSTSGKSSGSGADGDAPEGSDASSRSAGSAAGKGADPSGSDAGNSPNTAEEDSEQAASSKATQGGSENPVAGAKLSGQASTSKDSTAGSSTPPSKPGDVCIPAPQHSAKGTGSGKDTPSAGQDAGSSQDGDAEKGSDQGGSSAATGDSTVSSATMSWGLRESFRNYIQGGIARGDWSLNGITYEGGQYIWSGGSGELSDGTGSIGYSGGVHFTGHKGVLDMTLSNPRIEITGSDSAVLYADVVSSDMDGEVIDLTGVHFADISGAISVSDDSVSMSGGTVTLTGDGAKAFAGFYSAGEPLDPISFSGTLEGGGTAAQSATPLASISLTAAPASTVLASTADTTADNANDDEAKAADTGASDEDTSDADAAEPEKSEADTSENAQAQPVRESVGSPVYCSDLAKTGADSPLFIAAAGLLLVIVGTIVVALRRQQMSQVS